MTVATPRLARRQLHYASLSDFMADAERLAHLAVRTVGGWTFPQILEHLAIDVECASNGYGFKAPWFARVLVAPFVKNSIITKGMRPGFKLPKRAAKLMPDSNVSLESSLARLQAAVANFNKGHTEEVAHPFLGQMALQEWVSYLLRHAELHMSFVVPVAT